MTVARRQRVPRDAESPERRPEAAARDRRAAVALAVMLVAAALIRWRLAAVPLERDEGEYAYMGQLILAGEVPYLAAANMKLPGVYYCYAAILALLGQTDVAIRVGLIVVNAVAIVLMYLLARVVLGVRPAIVAAAAYAMLSLSQSVAGFSANTEHFTVVPVLAGILLLARLGDTDHDRARVMRIAVAGLLLGIAVVMKQHAAAFVLFGAVLVLHHARGARRSTRTPAMDGAVYAIGALVPYAATCVALYLAGAFGSFWFWTVTYARTYAAVDAPSLGVAALTAQLARMAHASVPLWAAAVVGLAAPLWDAEARRIRGFLWTFSACALLAVIPGLLFRDHYFILALPAAALLVAVATQAIGRIISGDPGTARRFAGAVAALAVVGSVAQERAYLFTMSPDEVSRAVSGLNPFPEAVEIARWVREHTAPGDRVAVIGSEPQIYFYARRRAATSFMYTYPLMEPQPFARRMQDDMIAELEREQPRILVLVNVDASWLRRPDSDTHLMRWAESTVNEHYRPVGLAEIGPDGETRYRWGDDAAAPPRSSVYVATFERRTP